MNDPFRSRIVISLLLLSVMLTAQSVNAAAVWLNNGDRISGEISIEEDRVCVLSEFGDTFCVNREYVQSIGEVALLDESKATEDQLDSEQVAPPSSTSVVPAANIENSDTNQREAKANPIDAIFSDEREIVARKGNIVFSTDNNQGNTDTMAIDIDAAYEWKTSAYRNTIKFDWDKKEDDGEETEDKFKLQYQYDYFLDQGRFVSTQLGYAEDEFKGLDNRYQAGLGLGKQFWDDEEGAFQLEGGVSYVIENLTDETVSQAALRFASKYKKNYTSQNVVLFNDVQVLLSAAMLSDTLLETRTGLQFKFNQQFSTTLQVEFDFDNEPATGQQKSDVSYKVGLGYDW